MQTKPPTKRTLKLAAKAYALSMVALATGSVEEEETAVLADIASDEALETFFKLFPDEETLPSNPAACLALAVKYTKRGKAKK